MTEAMPFLQKIDITFLRPPTIPGSRFLCFPLRLFMIGTEQAVQSPAEQRFQILAPGMYPSAASTMRQYASVSSPPAISACSFQPPCQGQSQKEK